MASSSLADTIPRASSLRRGTPRGHQQCGVPTIVLVTLVRQKQINKKLVPGQGISVCVCLYLDEALGVDVRAMFKVSSSASWPITLPNCHFLNCTYLTLPFPLLVLSLHYLAHLLPLLTMPPTST